MGKPTTKAKMKYNRTSYKRYEFNVKVESKLNAIIERYKQEPENNLSELIKSCLCDHFGIDRYEANKIYVPYYFGKGDTHIPNNELDKYFEKLEKNSNQS